MAHRYEVLVGNVGTVYSGSDIMTAHDTYRAYVALAKRYEGRCAGEPVTLFEDGEIVAEKEGRE